MSDSLFDPPDHRHPPPQSCLQLIEPLWAIRKGGQRYDAELRDHGKWGVEFRLLREFELLYGRRWPTRALALAEADERKALYLREGGIVVS